MPYRDAMSRLRRRFSHLYRIIASMAIMAMLMPMITMLVHHPASMVMQPVTSLAASMPNCSMMMAGMAMPAQEKSADNQPIKNKTPNKICPICQGLHLLSGGFVPPEVGPVALPMQTVSNVVQVHAFRLSIFDPAYHMQPRAPPTRT